MSKEERFELSCCLFNESNMDFIRDKKTNEEYVVLDELVPILNQQDAKISDLEAKLAESEIRSKESEIFYKREINRRDTKLRNIKQQLAEMTEKYNACQEARKLEIEFNQQDKAELKQQLAEKDEAHMKAMENALNDFLTLRQELTQDKISFAVDILEELADCSNYINSKLDFECGSYVSEKAIRDKIKYLKGKKDE